MKLRKAILLVPILLALCVGTALAKPAPTHPGLDPTFGRNGTTTVAVPKGEQPIEGFAVASGGRAYVLRGVNLFAFEADGKVARGFGKNGRITVAPAAGEGDPRGLAVDSRGRILVTGSTYLGSQLWTGAPPWPGAVQSSELFNAYVIRFLSNGSRDAAFGSGGEVDTDFGLPRAGVAPERPIVQADAIAVDGHDRPIIGGQFVQTTDPCVAYPRGTNAPFVARLTASGVVDTTFAGTGYAIPAGRGEVTTLAETPGGGTATLSRGFSCGPRTDEEPSLFSAFGESGVPSPGLDQARPTTYLAPAMAVDPNGRILVTQVAPWWSPANSALMRLLPSGDADPSFGQGGGMPLTAGVGAVRTFTVDAKSRPIVAGGKERIELRRLHTDGKIDRGFGPHARLTAKGSGADAVALDGHGRIYTVSPVESSTLKTGTGIELARFLPGR